MGIGSGLGGSLGVAKESVFGTYVAPTKFYELNSETLARKPNNVSGGGLAAGRFLKPSSRYVQTYREGGGDLEFEVTTKSLGLWLQALMGGTPTNQQQGATAAWLETFLLGDTKGQSLTLQKGVPTTAGTVVPYTFTGCKVTDAEFACGVGELLIAKFSVDAQDYTDATALAAPSYPTGQLPRNFSEMAVKLGTFGAEASVSGVRKVTTKISRSMNTAMQYAGGGGKKAEPILNDFAAITGTIETDFATKADWADRVPTNTPVSLVWEFVGPIIATTFKETFRITLSSVEIEAGDPQLGGPDVVQPSFTFTALDDGTNPPVKIEYLTTDTSI